jgi:chromosome segregation ATPase
MEIIAYGVLGIILTAVVTFISNLIYEAFKSKNKFAGELLAVRQQQNEDNDEYIENEIKSLKNILKKLEDLINKFTAYIDVQTEKNNHWAEQIKLLWDKYNETAKELRQVSDRTQSLDINQQERTKEIQEIKNSIKSLESKVK